MRHREILYSISLFLAGLFLSGNSFYAQFYDGLQVEFGKNRVQYRDFVWQYHSEGIFEIYYYQGGKELAGDIAGIVNQSAKDLKPYFGSNLEGPVQILVYNNIAEFRQSNIGVLNGDSGDDNIGGTAKIIGNKLFIYGTGDRRRLEQDLKEGLARIALHQTLYRGGWQDALRNSSMLQIPDWFEEGLVNYISTNKTAKANVHIFDSARSRALATIDRSEGTEAGELGGAVWDYVADVYGIPAIANVIYMVRVNRSVEGGFRFATGLGLKDLLSEVINYHLTGTPKLYGELLPPNVGRKNRKIALKNGGNLGFNLRKRYDYLCFSHSPDGETVAFITDERGQLRVWTYNINEGKIERWAQHGHKLDLIKSGLTPTIAWHPNGEQFTYTIIKKGQPVLVTVRLGEKPIEKELFKIDEVLSMDYSPDGRSIVFSGMSNGRSDLYIYRVIGNLQEPLWRDRFDDLHPRFTKDGKSIIFSSNRPDSKLREDRDNIPFNSNLDLFIYHIDEEIRPIEQLVNTPLIDERYPVPLRVQEFIYLSEFEDGSQEMNWGWADSTILSIDTIIRYRTFFDTRVISKLDIPVLNFSCDTASGFCYGNTYTMRHLFRANLGRVPETKQRTSNQFVLTDGGFNANNDGVFIAPNWSILYSETEVDIRNYRFDFEEQKKKESDEKLPELDKTVQANQSNVQMKPSNYRLNFSLQKLQSQVSNAFGSQFYRVYDGTSSFQPGLGNATEIRISDLFDDKHVIAGFNIPANLNNSLIGISYFDLSKKVDRMFSFQRQGSTSLDPLSYSLVESQSHFARYRLTFPIDEVKSIRAGALIRLDRAVIQGTEMFSLIAPNHWTDQIGFDISFVHDDTRNPALNIREGLRAKVWAEFYLDGFNASFGTIGFDIRRYLKIYANSIIAFRAAGDWSIGELKLLHLLGGMDNSLSFSNNYGTPIDPSQSYSYQARITPMRGFANNARNGSNATVLNAELRVPVWSTIFTEPAKTDFIRNFQLIGFADIGSAWTGIHPYSEENTFNSTTIENNPITVIIENNREPIIYDFGYGVRSRVMGYWIAADWGWGIDDGRILPRKFTLSLNFDF